MISFSDSVVDERKNEILEILPLWNTRVLEVEYCDVAKLKAVKFLVGIRTREEFGQWLAQCEEMNKTSYSVRHSDAVLGKRIVFKQRLECQHNTRIARVYDPTVGRLTKNTNCPSKMTVAIHAVHDRYKGKCVEKARFYKHMPCEINILLTHNHSIDSAAALKFRKPSCDVREKLISLFEKGHSPATALESIKVDIQFNCQEYQLALADRNKCPDYHYCYNLYQKVFRKKYGPMDFNKEGRALLQQRLEEYNDEVGSVCAKMIVKDDDYIICICSPLMQKVHEHVRAAARLAFMDSTGSLDHDGSRLFVLLTHSECGGLPLGIIITSSESSEILELGLMTLKEIVGEKIFGGNIDGPSVFLTDDSQSEQNAIKRCFPKSKSLLCIFHVLQAVWRWLIKGKNNVPQAKQCEFFRDFKNILFAETRNEALVYYNQAKTNVGDNHTNYLKYLEGYWCRREQWALSYRIGTLVEGHHTNNISEAFMRILEDKIFERVQAFNVLQMTDFIITKVNMYFQRRLLAAASSPSLKSFSRQIKAPSDEILNKIKKVHEDIFLVPSEERHNHFYIVNMSVLICTCFQGNTGSLCKHVDWASTMVSSQSYMDAINSTSIRRLFYFIATNEEPPEGWLEPLISSQSVRDVNSEEIVDQMDVEGPMPGLHEESEHVVHMEIIPERRNEELIKKIQSCLTDFSNKSPEEIGKALEKMYEKLRTIKNPSTCASYLSNFGEGQSRTNRGKYISVQPTAISRRKTKLVGRRTHAGGRQRSLLRKQNETAMKT